MSICYGVVRGCQPRAVFMVSCWRIWHPFTVGRCEQPAFCLGYHLRYFFLCWIEVFQSFGDILSRVLSNCLFRYFFWSNVLSKVGMVCTDCKSRDSTIYTGWRSWCSKGVLRDAIKRKASLQDGPVVTESIWLWHAILEREGQRVGLGRCYVPQQHGQITCTSCNLQVGSIQDDFCIMCKRLIVLSAPRIQVYRSCCVDFANRVHALTNEGMRWMPTLGKQERF